MVTKLRELLDKGYTVMQSSLVQPGTHVTYDTEESVVVAVNPWDYPYLDFENPFDAHTLNMGKIYANLERMTEEALERLDKMVDQMNRKDEPALYLFFPFTTVVENEDGSFTFNAEPFGTSIDEHRALEWVEDRDVHLTAMRDELSGEDLSFNDILAGEEYYGKTG